MGKLMLRNVLIVLVVFIFIIVVHNLSGCARQEDLTYTQVNQDTYVTVQPIRSCVCEAGKGRCGHSNHR